MEEGSKLIEESNEIKSREKINKKLKAYSWEGKAIKLIFLPEERALHSMWHLPEGKQ